MAYQDTHNPSVTDSFRNGLSAASRFFAMIGNALVNAAEANHRLKTVERLQEKSDAELEALGIRREDIVRHVFRDVFYC